jgi:cyclase
VKAGRVVKGIKFQNLQDISEPVVLAKKYYEQGADEVTFLDISASLEGRLAIVDVVEQCANEIFIPLTVGGGIRSVAEVKTLLAAGADKVSVGSAGLSDPNLISDIATTFGSQVVVVSLDVKRGPSRSGFVLTRLGGTEDTGIDALAHIGQLSGRGAGELLVNSIDADGTKQGFDVELMRLAREATDLPVIASGGAGNLEDFVEAARCGANALLAASVFHSGALSIGQVKVALQNAEVEVRL